MANISTYPIGTPSASDLLAGTELYTDSTGKQENLTRNFTVQSVASFANSYSLGYTVYTAALTAGTGVAPTPGEQGFTGTPQNGQQQQPQQQATNTQQPQADGQQSPSNEQLQ